MQTHVLVCTYNIAVPGHQKQHHLGFSKQRQVLLDQGWQMKGALQSHVAVERFGSIVNVWVTLIQDFERDSHAGEDEDTEGT